MRLGAKVDELCVQQTKNNFNLYRLLLKLGGIKTDRNTLLNFIGRCEKLEMVDSIKDLVNQGCDPNEIWRVAINLGSRHQAEGEEVIRFLINRGADINHVDIEHRDYSPPLLMAISDYPNKEIIKILINAGANINAKIEKLPRPRWLAHENQAPRSLLYYAIEKWGTSNAAIGREIIELLLEHGASL